MPEPDWDAIAGNLIDGEEQNLAQQQPRGYSVLVEWKGDVYIGSLQHVAPEYSDEIVLLSKSSQPIPPKLKIAILRAQPQRTQVSAVRGLDLEGRLHVIRKVNEQLEIMTSDQLGYMRQKPMVVGETNTGDVTSTIYTQKYKGGKKFNPNLN